MHRNTSATDNPQPTQTPKDPPVVPVLPMPAETDKRGNTPPLRTR